MEGVASTSFRKEAIKAEAAGVAPRAKCRASFAFLRPVFLTLQVVTEITLVAHDQRF